MKLLSIAFALTLTLSAWAGSHEVLRVTTDQDSRLVSLIVETNEQGDFVALRQITSLQNAVTSNYAVSEDQGRKGFVLCKEGSYDVIRLKILDRFEPVYGGPVKLDYLVNGIKGSRASVELEAAREGNRWVIKHKGSVVKKAMVVSNKILGKVIGVSQIKF